MRLGSKFIISLRFIYWCYIRGCQSSIFHRVFFVVNIMRWLITSGLANQSSPTLTTPKMHKYLKIIIKLSFLHLYVNEPLYIRKNPFNA